MLPLSIIDAFTDTPFAGNPAAVCFLPKWPSDKWLQFVGREMNLSETAFLVPRNRSEFELRWFTPKIEVSLCGHATLASAHFLWEQAKGDRALTFHTKSGPLAASRPPSNDIELDFPARPATVCAAPQGMLEALGAKAVSVANNSDDYLVEVATEAEVRALAPNFTALAQTQTRGVIVTAKASDSRFDFVSRFFAPAAGVNEDPVTGSAHCCLSEWWGDKLAKSEMSGFQASERGGVVRVKREAGRVKLIGRAVTVTRGQLLVPLS